MSIYSKTAAGWVEVAGGSSKAALSSWGRVVGEPTGAVTSTYFSNDDGSQWQYWEFNSPGEFEIDLGNGGLFWCLAVSGGSNGVDNRDYLNRGQPGTVREGLWEFGPGKQTVYVGDTSTYNQSPYISYESYIGDFFTPAVSWGDDNRGRDLRHDEDSEERARGFTSSITGDALQYANGLDESARPGRAGRAGGAQPGTVIIATRIDVEQLAPAPAELAPAPVLGAPVKVSGTADVVEYIVRQTDGTRKKIYMLPGNTAGGDENVFEVALGAGTLNGIMVAAGGMSGYTTETLSRGGGGAGGVIGTGARVPVILPIQGAATYTFKVASTTNLHYQDTYGRDGQDTSIAVQGQEPFAAAIGGGRGASSVSGARMPGGNGGSGGGSYIPWTATSSGNRPAGKGVTGQGHDGNYDNSIGRGGGGGYGSGGQQTGDGGSGFDLASALSLDSNDGPTATFLAAVTVDGFIAGGGAGANGTSSGGGGVAGNTADAHGKSYTGGGGGTPGANNIAAKNGGCGVVYLITDV